MAGRAVIHYKKNDIRLTALNFLTGAFLYMYLAGEVIGGRNFSSDSDGFYESVILFAVECVVCAGSIIAAVCQQRYNRRLAETGSGINRWFLSERAFNRLTAATMLLIGWYLVSIPLTESRSGLATGGLFFDNYRFAAAPQSFDSLLYFHFAICALPFVGGAWLLLFQPQKKSFNRK